MKELSDLRNVGKAVLRDLRLLGIGKVEELKGRDPTEMFYELERVTGIRPDPCMWDVFAAIIHEAEGGEPKNWWEWTKVRKARRVLG